MEKYAIPAGMAFLALAAGLHVAGYPMVKAAASVGGSLIVAALVNRRRT